MLKVALNDLSRATPNEASEIEAALLRVARSGWFVLGPEVAAFESEFAAYCGVPHCIGVGNGTDALELAVRALECRADDEVITVANAGLYAAGAIAAAGARPAFVDVRRSDMTMDPDALAAALNPRTRAVIVTHLYGQMADMTAIRQVLSSRTIPIIEDCAQAHGAERDGRKAGAWGTIGCFSFYPTKNLGALGDGGALTTADPNLNKRLRALRQYGWTSRYEADVPGGRNSRLDELQAAVLRIRLASLDVGNAKRRAIVAAYRAAIGIEAARLPDTSRGDHVAHLCVPVVERRDEARERLRGAGIETSIHYPIPDHRQAAMARFVTGRETLPETDYLAKRIFSLPCFPAMSKGEIDYVASHLSEAIEAQP